MDAKITSLNLAQEFPTNYYKICYEQGEALANLGRYSEALANFDACVAIKPDESAAWVFRGVVLIHLELYSEALASCEKALEIHPNDKQAWLFQGVALNYLGHYKQSYASYNTALGIVRQSRWQRLRQMFKRIFRLGNDCDTTSTRTFTTSS